MMFIVNIIHHEAKTKDALVLCCFESIEHFFLFFLFPSLRFYLVLEEPNMEDEILLRQYSNHIYWKPFHRGVDGDDDCKDDGYPEIMI